MHFSRTKFTSVSTYVKKDFWLLVEWSVTYPVVQNQINNYSTWRVFTTSMYCCLAQIHITCFLKSILYDIINIYFFYQRRQRQSWLNTSWRQYVVTSPTSWSMFWGMNTCCPTQRRRKTSPRRSVYGVQKGVGVVSVYLLKVHTCTFVFGKDYW